MFNLPQFITQARAQGVPDNHIYDYLGNKGLVPDSNTGNVAKTPSQSINSTNPTEAVKHPFNVKFKPGEAFPYGGTTPTDTTSPGEMIKGLYNHQTKELTIAENDPKFIQSFKFILLHEYAHSLGERDEQKADAFAQQFIPFG